MIANLHVVRGESDQDVLLPVTESRVRDSLIDLGARPRFDPGTRGVSAVIDEQLLQFRLGSSGTALSVHLVWDTCVPYEAAEGVIFAAADTWNRERYFPTVYLRESRQGSASVIADYVIPCRYGLSTRQLEGLLQVGITTDLDALRFMHNAVSSMLSIAPRP